MDRPMALLYSPLLFIELVAVIGILREHKWTVFIYLALSVLSFIANTVFEVSLGVLHIAIIGMTSIYACILQQNDQIEIV